jgi:hypothetical protein
MCQKNRIRGGKMQEKGFFWRRQVSDTLAIWVLGGANPCLLIDKAGGGLVRIELSEVEPLTGAMVEALTTTATLPGVEATGSVQSDQDR